MMAEESNYAESPYVASRTALLARQKREPGSDGVSSGAGSNGGGVGGGNMMSHHPHSAAELLTGHQDRRVSPPQSIHSSFQRQHQIGHQPASVNLVPQHSFSYNNQHQQQQMNLMINHHHNHHHPHQQISSSNGVHTLTNSMSSALSQQQQQQHQHHHDTSTSTSGVSTLMSQMMMDKENRQGFGTNGTSSSESNNSSSRFSNSLNVSKSNAIFDRFDIMNSEKQHRFKVCSKNLRSKTKLRTFLRFK